MLAFVMVRSFKANLKEESSVVVSSTTSSSISSVGKLKTPQVKNWDDNYTPE